MTTIEERIIDSRPHVGLSETVRELWGFRATILAFTERHVRVKYKQTILGIGWAVIQPLAFVAIVTFTLGRSARFASGGVPYAATALAAMVPWMFVQNAVSLASTALISDAWLVRRTYFPREIPVLATVFATGLDLGIGLILFAIIGPIIGARVTVFWLLALPLSVLLGVLTTAISLILSALAVPYRDFRIALPVMLQLWLFASPVAYPLSVVPHQWRGLYLVMNPAAGLMDAFRRILAEGVAPDAGNLAISVAGTALLSLIGYVFFKRRERTFAEVI